MNSSILIRKRGLAIQGLPKLRGNRTGVVAALFAMFLLIVGCGGNSKSPTPTPTFTPAAGSYSSAQNVTVADSNQSAVLYCTTDGSVPTTSSPQCANPIKVSQSQTLNAIAIAPGMNPSAVAAAQYTIGSTPTTPTVTGIGPATGPTSGGTAVTIIGTNFTGATAVNFGTLPATSYVVNSASSITATSPAAGAGAVNITVVTPAGTTATNNADLFTYTISPTPSITSITPNSGLVGSSVAILGSNFGSTQGSSTVSFNGTLAAAATTWTSTGIVVTVPIGATSGNVVVTVGGVASVGVPFAVTIPAPTISLITPNTGGIGTSVTIVGTNFGTAKGSVSFNGTPATITSWGDQAIVVLVPSGLSAGGVPVLVTTADNQTATTTFTVAAPAPTISGITPGSGTAGTTVTISGSGFGSSQGTVTFDNIPATIKGWSDGSISVTVPSGLTAGSVNVAVTTTGNQTANVSFTVTVSGPTISSIDPTSGTAGTTVTIMGSGFGSTPGTVSFGNTQATVASGNWADGSITTTVPSGVSAGSATVTVTTANNQTASTSFTVSPSLPTISGIVVSGPASSGAPISASVQLYAAGTTGYGAGAQAIGDPVQTDSTTGAFSGIAYDCSTLVAPGDQLYLEAIGDSSQVAFMAALGSCGVLNTSGTIVTVNEVTTIASAYALSAFADIDSKGGIDVGAPATGSSCNAAGGWKSTGPSTCNYIGLANAFATANNLIDLPSGTALSVTPAYKSNNVAGYNTSIVPQARINSLADALSSCANPTTGSSANCGSLFGDATVGTSVPADTLQATLNIAQNPGNNATQIASLAAANASFPSALTSTQLSALTDWALPIIYQGAGIGNTTTQPTGMAVDGAGNIWITAQNTSTLPTGTGTETGGLVALFSNQGAPISPSATSASSPGGYVSGGILNPQAIAIDQNNYAWIGNFVPQGGTAGSITVLDKNGHPQYGTDAAAYTTPLLMLPNRYGIAVDADNDVWISSNNAAGWSNNGGITVCGGGTGSGPYGGDILGLKVSGNAVSTNGVIADYFSTDNSTCPTFLAIDQNSNMWTFDYGNFNGLEGSQYDGPGLELFRTADGSLAGGAYFNAYPFDMESNLVIDSGAYGWSVEAFQGIGNSSVQEGGTSKMPNFNGITDPTVIGVFGPPTPYDPTVFNPSSTTAFQSSVAIDGAGQVWVAGANGPEAGLFAVNNANTQLLSPANGYIDNDTTGAETIYTASGNPVVTAIDNSGNVWVVGESYNKATGNNQGNQLAEYVGIGVPVQTPLVSGLVNGNTPGTKP